MAVYMIKMMVYDYPDYDTAAAWWLYDEDDGDDDDYSEDCHDDHDNHHRTRPIDIHVTINPIDDLTALMVTRSMVLSMNYKWMTTDAWW